MNNLTYLKLLFMGRTFTVTLKKVNIDPAIASSVFVTTITDVIGFLSFLGLGSYYFLN